MSTRDFFKNSVLEAFGQVDPAKIGLSLLVALAMGILIYYVYKRFFRLFGGFCGRDSGIGPAQRAKTTIWN